MTDNELIAEFMGWKRVSIKTGEYWDRPNQSGISCYYTDKFQTSWDWLMPVVDKIESGTFHLLNFGVSIGMHDWVTIRKRHGIGDFDEFIQIIGPDKLTATHKAVVEFIKWYNQQK